jgi:hypothetical protein
MHYRQLCRITAGRLLWQFCHISKFHFHGAVNFVASATLSVISSYIIITPLTLNNELKKNDLNWIFQMGAF